jgi:uncharacterized protein (DUF305 family)
MNKELTYIVISVAFGLLLGWLFWGYHNYLPKGSHQMSGGMMMNDNQMMQNQMSMRQMMDAMGKNLEGKTGSDFDSAFLEEMIPHHLGAIDMARMVLATSKRPELIKMANDIITAQQKEIDMMREWERTWFGVKAQ